MKIIGLTGGSGAGKSTVAQTLHALGAGWVDADAVYHRLCPENREMLAALCGAFGDVLDADGALDRNRLAPIVFSDAARLALLNQITIPYIREASQQAFSDCAARGCPFTLYDAPTLFQSGADDLCRDGVIGVIAPREIRIRRIMERDGLSCERAAARIDAQPDDDFYRRRCRWLIENDTTRDAAAQKSAALFQELNGDSLPKSEYQKSSLSQT